VKASRAYIASLGTSGVLIASFLLLLAVVSAIVAFRGAPGAASNDGVDRLDVSHGRQASGVSRAAQLGAEGPRTASDRGGRGRARGAGGGAGPSAAGGKGERSASGGLTSGPAPAGESGSRAGDGLLRLPAGPAQPGGVAPAPSPGDVAGQLEGAVEETAGGPGGTVGTVAPPVEAPTVETGAGVVEPTVPVVEDVVGGVTEAPGALTDAVPGATDGLPGAP
jgi:hypothetical protein